MVSQCCFNDCFSFSSFFHVPTSTACFHAVDKHWRLIDKRLECLLIRLDDPHFYFLSWEIAPLSIQVALAPAPTWVIVSGKRLFRNLEGKGHYLR